MKEVWKDIKGYEGSYQVSNLGRIKSLERDVICNNNGATRKVKEKILHPSMSSKGYMHIKLGIGGIKCTKRVHRLVAEAFIPNPNKYPVINHKDCNRTNNCIDNLEWCTYQYNVQYTFKMGYKDSLETRMKKSNSHKGMKLSEETKRKISESNKYTKNIKNANQDNKII